MRVWRLTARPDRIRATAAADLTHLREDVRKAIATRGWTARPFTARLEYAHFSTEQVLKVRNRSTPSPFL